MTLIDKALLKVYGEEQKPTKPARRPMQLPSQDESSYSHRDSHRDSDHGSNQDGAVETLAFSDEDGDRELYLHPPGSPLTGSHYSPTQHESHGSLRHDAGDLVAEGLRIDDASDSGTNAVAPEEPTEAHLPEVPTDDGHALERDLPAAPFPLRPGKKRLPRRLIRLLSYEVSTDDVADCGWQHVASVSTIKRAAPVIDPLPEQDEQQAGAENANDATASPVDEFPPEEPVELRVRVDSEESETTESSDDTNEQNAAAEARTAEAIRQESEAIEYFKAAWEVDQFRLPEICQKAEHVLDEKTQLAAQQLVDDCRPTHPVVTIGSWARKEGRTTVALLLARALAKAGLQVALVDGDLDNPQLARSMGVAIDPEQSLGEATVPSIAERSIRSVSDRFTLVPLPELAIPTAEARRVIAGQVEVLSRYFQIVIVDQGPGSSDTYGDVIGCHVVVNAHHEPEHPSVDWAARLQRSTPVPVRLVENFAIENEEPNGLVD